MSTARHYHSDVNCRDGRDPLTSKRRRCFTSYTGGMLSASRFVIPMEFGGLASTWCIGGNRSARYVCLYRLLDESGTHDGSPITVMGGLLARAEQWERFEKGFAELQRKHNFKVWHSKKFRQRKGDFKGWSDYQRTALYWDLARLTNHRLTEP